MHAYLRDYICSGCGDTGHGAGAVRAAARVLAAAAFPRRSCALALGLLSLGLSFGFSLLVSFLVSFLNPLSRLLSWYLCLCLMLFLYLFVFLFLCLSVSVFLSVLLSVCVSGHHSFSPLSPP